MAHECFEDAEVAAVMNDLFVNVKVDREERPDVDAVYMDAVQALTGRGGWPMTVFLSPDGRPFYGGTYFPKPAFLQLMAAIDDAWRNQRDKVDHTASELVKALDRTASLSAGEDLPGVAEINAALQQLAGAFDSRWGGFGPAPKFPQTMNLELLLRASRAGAGDGALQVVTTTLDAMASGGIYDHLGGGFARYSVDERWLVPHFEKMLYDQALLIQVYLHAFQVTGHERYRQVIEETVGYVLRDLRHPSGGFYSSEDADSEGEEGRFYVWTSEQIVEVLGQDRAEAVMDWYGVTEEGNFEGHTILHRPVRGDLLRPPAVEEARAALFEAREQRVRPGLDDKVLTEWNGLMLAALAEAARRWSGTTGCRRRVRTRRCSSPTCGGTTAAGSVPGRPTAAPATTRSPPTTPPWWRPSSRWPRRPARRAGSTRPARWPTPCSTTSGTSPTAGCPRRPTTARR